MLAWLIVSFFYSMASLIPILNHCFGLQVMLLKTTNTQALFTLVPIFCCLFSTS